jgi:hypothetical protein
MTTIRSYDRNQNMKNMFHEFTSKPLENEANFDVFMKLSDELTS